MSGTDYPGGKMEDANRHPGPVPSDQGPSYGYPAVAPMMPPPTTNANYPPPSSDVGLQPMQPAWPGYSAYPSMAGNPPPQYQPPPGQPYQMYGQQVPQQVAVGVVIAPNGQMMYPQSFVGQIAYSCFVAWCCNWLFGLIAFILAMVASSQAVSDPRGARKLGYASYAVSTAGIVVTVVIISILVGLIVAGAKKAIDCPYTRNGDCYSYRFCNTNSLTCRFYSTNTYYGSDYCCYYSY